MQNLVYPEIVRILLRHSEGFEAKVGEFSKVQCVDPQLPLTIIHSLLSDAALYEETSPKIDLNRLSRRDEYLALIDIVHNSPLNSILVVDTERRELRFRDECPVEERKALGEYVVSNTGAIS